MHKGDYYLVWNISALLSEGEKRGLLRIKDSTIEYLVASQEYSKTEEERVRAALYVYLVIDSKILTDRIIIERDRIDIGISDASSSVEILYECKAHCNSNGELLAAQEQARAYATTQGIQKAFIAFNGEDKLVITEVPLKFKIPEIQPAPNKPKPVAVSTINLKGGVGKTSITCALAEFLCLNHGKRVLVIDLDPQTNATVVLMGENEWKKERDDKRLTLAHFFEERIKNPRDLTPLDPRKILVRNTSNIGSGIKGLDLLPSSPHFVDIQEEIPSIPQRRYGAGSYVAVLKEALTSILGEQSYDYILIDCPPSLGSLTQNGFCISKYYLIPCVPDWLSTYGIPLILRQSRGFSKAHSIQIDCLGVVFCRYRRQLSLHQKTIERYQALEGRKVVDEPDSPAYPPVFTTVIPETGKAEEAVEPGRAVNTLKQKYGYGSPSIYDKYENLAIEFLQKVEAYEKAKTSSA